MVVVVMTILAGAAGELLPSTMRAFVRKNPGNPASQQFVSDAAVPQLGDLHRLYQVDDANCTCEVLLRVYGSSVNPSDITPTVAGAPDHVLGSDVAGKVVALSDDGSCTGRIAVGDVVWGDIGANTRTKQSGAKTKELGGYGEYAVAFEAQLGVAPTKTISWQQAAVLPKVALTSYKALVWYTGAPSWPKETVVLVLGGSGGTGSVGIQLARHFGAAQIITTTSAANFEYCKKLGATRLINYHTTDWWTALAENSVDVIYDTVGQTGTGDRAMALIRTGGAASYVTITGALASHAKPGVRQNMFINSDTNLDNHGLLDALSAIVNAGNLSMSRINATFPLEQIPAAFQLSKTGHVDGKILVTTGAAP